jgi:hypothetical protein
MKYTMQEARKILGVTKSSLKDDIEKKYDVIMKKYRILKSNGTLGIKDEEDFAKKTEAYRIVMGYEVDIPHVERKETYTDKAFQKAGVDRKKADNFFHYYKFHILISIVAIIVVVLTVRSFVTKVEPDITIGVMGEVNQQAFDALGAKIKAKVPEIKEVAFDSAMLTDNYNDPQAYAYMSKAMILLSVSETDLFIVNKYAYERYANSGPFMSLEDVAKELEIDVSKSEYLKVRVVDEWEDPENGTEERKVKTYRDAEPLLYGIDVSNSEFFKDVNVVGPEKILVVKVEPENRDLILKLMKLFAK